MANANILGRQLMYEIEHNGGDNAGVRVMLEQGAPVNYRGNGGITPLHLAISLSDIDLVRILLAHGADKTIEIPNPVGRGMVNAVQAVVIMAMMYPGNDDNQKIVMALGGYLGPPGGDPNSANRGGRRTLRKKRKSRRYRRN